MWTEGQGLVRRAGPKKRSEVGSRHLFPKLLLYWVLAIANLRSEMNERSACYNETDVP